LRLIDFEHNSDLHYRLISDFFNDFARGIIYNTSPLDGLSTCRPLDYGIQLSPIDQRSDI